MVVPVMGTLRAFTVRMGPVYVNTALCASYRRISRACCASSSRTSRVHLASAVFIAFIGFALFAIELSTLSHTASFWYICALFSSPHGSTKRNRLCKNTPRGPLYAAGASRDDQTISLAAFVR